jgi:hypothetical protein
MFFGGTNLADFHRSSAAAIREFQACARAHGDTACAYRPVQDIHKVMCAYRPVQDIHKVMCAYRLVLYRHKK